ncbi:hypothetical protein L596_026299 [Steinernema carpocapsae]|uniref:Uncharacterized protein n=1 Tax=Steinernema carpocapsae TaxID=34508 RepID=A0A4U5M0X2_STECR|nr:hypothetical protein L596_026299 [Steinernema carpocapsae]
MPPPLEFDLHARPLLYAILLKICNVKTRDRWHPNAPQHGTWYWKRLRPADYKRSRRRGWFAKRRMESGKRWTHREEFKRRFGRGKVANLVRYFEQKPRRFTRALKEYVLRPEYVDLELFKTGAADERPFIEWIQAEEPQEGDHDVNDDFDDAESVASVSFHSDGPVDANVTMEEDEDEEDVLDDEERRPLRHDIAQPKERQEGDGAESVASISFNLNGPVDANVTMEEDEDEEDVLDDEERRSIRQDIARLGERLEARLDRIETRMAAFEEGQQEILAILRTL